MAALAITVAHERKRKLPTRELGAEKELHTNMGQAKLNRLIEIAHPQQHAHKYTAHHINRATNSKYLT